MHEVFEINRQGRAVLDEIETCAADIADDQVRKVLWNAYWELTRVSERLYECQLEIGGYRFENRKLVTELMKERNQRFSNCSDPFAWRSDPDNF